MKVLILAAGRGERLRPFTDSTPKPLLQVGGRPLIEHIISNLSDAGFNEFIVNLSHLGEKIQAHLGDGSQLGVQIDYSCEENGALETGGGIFQALPLLGTEPFMVVNGDVATDFPFSSLRNCLDGLAHLVLVGNPPHHPQGDFALEGGQVMVEGVPKHTFSGIGVYRPELFAGCQPGRFPLAPLLREAMAKKSVSGQIHKGFWMDIGTIERLRELDEHLTNSCVKVLAQEAPINATHPTGDY